MQFDLNFALSISKKIVNLSPFKGFSNFFVVTFYYVCVLEEVWLENKQAFLLVYRLQIKFDIELTTHLKMRGRLCEV